MDSATLEAVLVSGAVASAVICLAMVAIGATMDSRRSRRTCPKLSRDAVRMGREYGAGWIWRDGRRS